MKGYSQSIVGYNDERLPPENKQLYERVWDEADYVVPPAENGAFFITTNIVITPNQTMGQCPEVRKDRVAVIITNNTRTRGRYLAPSVELMIV